MNKRITRSWIARKYGRKPRNKNKKRKGKHTPPLTRSYKHRRKALKEIGFNSYQEYLKSDLWAKIREQILTENPLCIRCSQPATQVHHAEYSVKSLLGIRTDRMFSICTNCHKLAEFDQNGNKTTIGRANRFLGLAHQITGHPIQKRNLPQSYQGVSKST